jgi:vacuolar-type H+-ATPase subunit I/STV1
MLKLKLTSLEGLSDALKSEYKQVGDVFVLDTDVQFEDVSGLKSALDNEREHRRTATARVTDLEKTVADLTARAGGVSDVEKAYQEKLAKQERDLKAVIAKKQQQLHQHLVTQTAATLASEISISPGLLQPVIEARLQLDESGDAPILRVLTKDGKLSADSVNDLRKELVETPDYAAIIKASKAQGGGASGAKTNPGGKAFKDMTEGERTTLYRKDPEAYRAAKTASEAK